MARREARPSAQREVRLTPRSEECVSCGEQLWVAYHAQRALMTFRGLVRLKLVVRRCRNRKCDLYHLPYRAEEEGAWALPHGEFGLDIITVIGQLRDAGAPQYPGDPSAPGAARSEHRPAHRHGSAGTAQATGPGAAGRRWHAASCGAGSPLDHRRLLIRRGAAGADPAQQYARGPGHPALRGQGGSARAHAGVISDGQQTIRQAVARCLSGVPHQLCHFHYLDEAADPIFEADRHAKTELKKQMRGVRPIERSLEGREDEQSEAMRSYCLAVRSALTDDGRPPLCASGLKLYDRLTKDSLTRLSRVEGKRGHFLLH